MGPVGPMGIPVFRSSLPWSSPRILIRKSHFDPAKADQVDHYRLCVDMRKLNLVTKSEFQSLISIEQTCHVAASQQGQTQGQPNETRFTSFDLTASFYQQPSEENCRQYTAFRRVRNTWNFPKRQ
jgi:hypothetical protein